MAAGQGPVLRGQCLVLVFQTLEEVLAAVLRHPTLEGWFLALERRALPPHALSPVLAKLLAARLSAGVLQLLVASAPVLQSLGRLDLLARYSEAVTQTVLRELRELQDRKAGPAPSPPQTPPQLEALRGLHAYMEGAQLREVTLALLRLPGAHLAAHPPPESPGEDGGLSALGRTLVELLTRSPPGSAAEQRAPLGLRVRERFGGSAAHAGRG